MLLLTGDFVALLSSEMVLAAQNMHLPIDHWLTQILVIIAIKWLDLTVYL